MPNMIMKIFKSIINRIIRKKEVIEKMKKKRKKKRFKIIRESKSNRNSKNKRLTIRGHPLYR